MNETRKLRNDIISVIKGENEQNMILSKPVQRLQSWLLQHNGFKANSKENSIYKVYNTFNVPIQIRVSNHGTHLWTWVDREFDPSHSINISIVISDDGNVYNKDGEETDPNNDPHINIDKQHRKRNFGTPANVRGEAWP